jgi:hypothetical protein
MATTGARCTCNICNGAARAHHSRLARAIPWPTMAGQGCGVTLGRRARPEKNKIARVCL